MHRVVLTQSEAETKALAEGLAAELFEKGEKAFLSLVGVVGTGKSTFARGFIAKWCELAGEAAPESITSPTYNIARTYGQAKPVAHLDLYRLKSMQELEQLGFEHYFYEFSATLVEWLDQLPEVSAHIPSYALTVNFEFSDSKKKKTSSRKITIS